MDQVVAQALVAVDRWAATGAATASPARRHLAAVA
jgi:hypothetical protein